MHIFKRQEDYTFDATFQGELARESWTLYGLGMFFIALRTYARLRRNDLRGLALDDYLMWAAGAWYTTLIVCLNVIAAGGGSNLFPPEDLATFTEQDIKERIKGSKIVIVSEQAMLNVIYTLKICMLLIYTRLTVQLKHHMFVKALAVYVACGYVASQLAFFLACRPFHGYWDVPPPNPQCTTLENYAITQACFNISSDAFMLAISLPLLLNTTLPIKQKIVLVGIFGMGVFIIIAAILTKVFNLADVYSTVYMLWYVRESSVAVYVVNLPLIWPLLRDTFPILRSFTPGGKGYSSGRRGTMFNGISASRASHKGSSAGTGGKGDISTHDGGWRMATLRRDGRPADSISLDSDERVLNGKPNNFISTQTTVEVEEASVRGLERADSNESELHGWERTPGEEHTGYQIQIHGGNGNARDLESQ